MLLNRSDITPLPTALKAPPAASEASLAQCMSGKEKLIGLSFGEGAILSIQSLRATVSPVRAKMILLFALRLLLGPLGGSQ